MKFKVLKILSENNNFVSGEDIGNRLDISRAAVSKNVAKLKEMGYNIEAVNNKGYWLDKDYDIMNEFELKKGLETEKLAQNCIYFDEIDSTNEEAKRRADNEAEDGLLVFSNSQTAGKGRLGRVWKSEKDVSVYFSFILRPDIMPFEAPIITLVAGIGIMRALKSLTGLDVKIKWPNDIIINGKKAAGILTEMSAEMEQIKYIIVGIGINVNNSCFDDEIAFKATSIFMETGKKFKRIRLLQQCLKEIEACCNTFEKEGFYSLREEYRSCCANMGADVKLNYKGNEIEGLAVDISEKGEIVIENKNGERINVFGGEISLRRADGRYI